MADPTAIPAMALVLRPVVAFVVDVEVISKAEPEVEVAIVEVDVNVEVVADAEPEVEVAIVEVPIVDVELFELSAVLAVELLLELLLGLELETETDCVDEVLIGEAELLEEEVVAPGSIMNAGEGICDTPTKMSTSISS